LRSLWDLTRRPTTRADDSHAAPVHAVPILRSELIPLSGSYYVHVKPW